MTKLHAILYIVSYVAMLLAALFVAARTRRPLTLLQPAYWRWLLQPWKLATFAVASTALIAAAPYMKDPDWDRGVALLQSMLTFATAPWAVGTLLGRRGSRDERLVAVAVWLFSASWAFDLYWLARRGFYPDTWLYNLAGSSLLYGLAGLLWSFDWTRARGFSFSFRDADWPSRREAPTFARLAVPVALFMCGVGAAVFVPFLVLR
jgi:hypothetical protein